MWQSLTTVINTWFSLTFVQILSCLPRCCSYLKSEYKMLTIWSTWNLSAHIWIRIQTTVSFVQLLSALQMFLAHRRRKLKNLGLLAFLGRNFYSWYDFDSIFPFLKSIWIICKCLIGCSFLFTHYCNSVDHFSSGKSGLWTSCKKEDRHFHNNVYEWNNRRT